MFIVCKTCGELHWESEPCDPKLASQCLEVVKIAVERYRCMRPKGHETDHRAKVGTRDRNNVAQRRLATLTWPNQGSTVS